MDEELVAFSYLSFLGATIDTCSVLLKTRPGAVAEVGTARSLASLASSRCLCAYVLARSPSQFASRLGVL